MDSKVYKRFPVFVPSGWQQYFAIGCLVWSVEYSPVDQGDRVDVNECNKQSKQW